MTARRIFEVVFIATSLYVVAASIVHAFRHPEMTDTQRFLHIVDAICFR